VRRLQRELEAAGLAGALLVQGVDRFYLSGTLQAGYVAVALEGDPLVLVRRDPVRAAAESPFPVQPLGSVRQLSDELRAAFGSVPSPLGLEFDVLPVVQVERIRNLLPGVPFADASPALLSARSVKSPAEIELIRSAAEVVSGAVARVPELLQPGVREIDLAADLEREMRRAGHQGLLRMRGFGQEMFFGHVMAGASAATVTGINAPTGGRGPSAAFPQGSSSREIRSGEPVVVDLVGCWQGYHSDQTRMFSLGPPSRECLDMYRAALEVQAAVLAAVRPGVPGAELYRVAIAAAQATPYAGFFLGEQHKVGFVGHGIGLEVDEEPFLAPGYQRPLEEGMVFALEPKFIREGVHVVGVEDTFAVTAAGWQRLTPSPQEWGAVTEA
jgi:Xaa-Pro aminopeptidase